jgi:sugar lactone lactonase YvrE
VSVPLTPAGSGGPARQVFQFATPTVDGIAFDEYGRLWVARWVNGTLDVITLDGKLVAQVDAGGTRVTNLCFRDRSVYASVAGRNAIHRLDVGIGGAR